MREFQAKHKVRRVLYSKVTVLIIIIIIGFLAKAAWAVYQKERESAGNAAQTAKELGRLKDRQNLLNSEVNRLSNEDGVEEEIRSKYSVSKSGEHLLIIIDTATSAPAQAATSSQSWWEKFKGFFK